MSNSRSIIEPFQCTSDVKRHHRKLVFAVVSISLFLVCAPVLLYLIFAEDTDLKQVDRPSSAGNDLSHQQSPPSAGTQQTTPPLSASIKLKKGTQAEVGNGDFKILLIDLKQDETTLQYIATMRLELQGHEPQDISKGPGAEIEFYRYRVKIVATDQTKVQLSLTEIRQ